MNFLLDTHVLLWLDNPSHLLSERVTAIIKDDDSTLFLSYASIWEIMIKVGIGKLNLRLPLHELIQEQVAVNRLQLLPIEYEHIFALGRLPDVAHRDPFDRMLIAQALQDGLLILSNDSQFKQYPVTVIW
jgi:PIN domain nuclease of toxin-antitoxin system